MHDAHRYIQEHHDIVAMPPGARVGWLRRVVARALAHVFRGQNAFNLNVARTLDHLQQQQEAVQAQLDRLVRDAAAAHEVLRDLHVSRVQGDEIHRNLTAALEHVRDMQQHHGAVIGQMQQRIDTLTPLISRCQTTIEHVIARLRTLDQVMTGLAARQDDLQADLQRADDTMRRLTAGHDDLLAGLQRTDDTVRELTARHDDLLAGLQRTDDTVRELTARHDDLSAGLQRTNDTVRELTARHDDLVVSIQQVDEMARSLQKALRAANDHFEHVIGAVQAALAHQNARQDDLAQVQERLAAAQAGVTARQDDAVKSVATLAEQFAEGMRQAGEVGARITRAEAGFTALRAQTERLETQLALLRQTLLDALPHGTARVSARTKKEALTHLQRAWDDAEYQQFEARQRGSEADIQAHMQWCVELLTPVPTSAHEYILDLGCGTGELLALLEACGKHARGVDRNQTAIATARARGLLAECQDIFAALQDIAAGSVPVVTAFHLIEHLHHAHLVRLLRAVMRVLRPGGLFICETPNALNLRVAACEFYQDPTHVRVVHPALLRHLLHTTGFTAIEFRFLHPFPPDEQLQSSASAGEEIRSNFEKLNSLIWGARDCACIARKEASV